MKRRITLLGLLLLALVFPLAVPTRAQPLYLPHEDPALIQGQRDAYHWMLYYGEILDLVVAQNLEAARALLGELGQATFPAGLRELMLSFNGSLLLTLERLGDVQSALEAVPGLLASNRVEEARSRVEEALAILTDLDVEAAKLAPVALSLGEGLGAVEAPPGSRERLAYERVQGALLRLIRLYKETMSSLNSLELETQARAARLRPTLLTMQADRDSAFVGEEIGISGRLISQGIPLPGRAVTVDSDRGGRVSTTTGEEGSFRAVFRIPYAYVPSLALWSSYDPRGEDMATLQASRTPSVLVDVLFYRTGLEASWPRIGHPGLPLVVTGKVASQGEAPPRVRQVRVLFDGQPLAEAEATGPFQIEVVPPAGAVPGKHNLRVEVDPYLRYAGASREGELDLQLMPTTLHIRAPSLALAPGRLRISGRVSSTSGALSQASVQIGLRMGSTRATTTDGEFTADLRLPLALTLFGPQQLLVSVTPGEPWQAPATARARVFVINIAELGLFLVGVVALAGVLAVRRRSGPAPRLVGAEPEAVAPALPVELGTSPVDFPGRVLQAYGQATSIVSPLAGRSLTSALTLREFLRQVRPVLDGAEAAYTGLTLAAETALYSGHTLGEAEATRAEALARQVVEALSRGTL